MKSKWAIAVCGISVCLAAEVFTHGDRCLVAVKHAAAHHSPATIRKWKEWGASHPNWKPKTRTETIDAFEFACQPLAPIGEDVAEILPVEPLAEVPEIAVVPTPGPDLPHSAPVPVEQANGYPLTNLWYVPIAAPRPMPIQPTPEPGTIWLLATGAALAITGGKRWR